eukprot:gene7143-7948_t
MSGNENEEMESQRKRAAEDLVKKYFLQLTNGCGRVSCDNEFCASSGKHKDLNKDEAAALALGLLLKKARLCEIRDPLGASISTTEVGLSEAKLLEIVDLCNVSRDFKPLIRLIGRVFSSSQLLNQSFLLQEASNDSKIQIDVNQVDSSYQCLFSLEDPLVENALINALTSLGSAIEIDLKTNSDEKTASFINQFIIIFLNEQLSDPKYLTSAVPSILTAAALLPIQMQKVLVEMLACFDAHHLKQVLEMLHQFITIQILTVNAENGNPVNDDKNITAATKCMKFVYYASIAGGKFDIPSQFIADSGSIEAELVPSRSQSDDEKDKLLEALDLDPSKCRRPLIPCSEFINDILNEKIEMDRDFANYKYGQPRFSFLNHSFILNTATKSLGLYYDNRVRMYSERRITILLGLMQGSLDSFNSPYLRLRVRRDHLIEDALVRLEIISRDSPGDFKKQLIVEFDGEQGVDEGGVSKEFFQLVVEQLFNPDYGMFIYDELRRQYWFNPTSFETEGQFTLIGIVFGLAIYNGIILDVNFPPILYRKLLGLKGRYEDLESSHNNIYQSMTYMLQFEGDLENEVMTTFEVGYQDVFGQNLTHNLKENGSNIPVTQANKQEFVDLYADFLLNGVIETQFKAFKRGFDMVTEDSMVQQLFRPEEVELLLCGSKEFDVNHLESSTEYDGGYDKDHYVIKNFWQVVHAMSVEEQRQLIAFTTGSDRVPVGGLAKLKLIIARHGPDSERLPTAHTCFNVLLLPEYLTKEKLQERLLKAITHAKGFGMI